MAKKKNYQKKDIYEMVNTLITKKLEEGNIGSWVKEWKGEKGVYEGWNYNIITKAPYSFLNNLILECCKQNTEFKSNIWLTYNQVMDLKGDVKGEKTTGFVVFFKMLEKEVENEDGEKEIKTTRYLRYSNLFNLDQVSGIDKKKIPEVISGNDIVYNSNDIENNINGYCENEGIKQNYGGDRAFYSSQNDSITMPKKESFNDEKDFYKTYFHEMTHSTGVEKRLDRFIKASQNRKEDYAKEELIAEIGASYLCTCHGIENNIDNSISYIDGWKKRIKDNKYVLVQAFSQAEKACKYISEKMITKKKEVVR